MAGLHSNTGWVCILYLTEPKCALGLALWMNMVYSLAGCIDKHNMTETVLFTTTLRNGIELPMSSLLHLFQWDQNHDYEI